MNFLQRRADAVDWEHLDSDTRYLTHGLHRYSGKFIPQIARQSVELVSDPGEVVLDVYAGSGTTLLESELVGRKAVGVDLNPLACLISTVKTTPIDRAHIEKYRRLVIEEIENATNAQPPLFGGAECDVMTQVEADPRWEDPWFVKWFPPQRLRELLTISVVLKRVTDGSAGLVPPDAAHPLHNLGLVAFSEVIRQSSMANASYPNVMFDRSRVPARSAIPRFLRQLTEVCDAVARLGEAMAGRSAPLVLHASACELPLASASVDAIVTHPPYIGSVPYAEYGMLSLRWLGHDHKQLDRVLTGGRRQSRDVVDRFRVDFAESFRECARVLKPGRHLAMLLGCPTVKGERIDLPQMARGLAVASGFRIDASVTRQGGNRRANLMASETLVFFQRS